MIVPSLVSLVGPSGSGKSSFARRLFGRYEVVSSDMCRAMIADTEDDQSVTPEAFELLRYIARQRLAAGRIAVVDATNVLAVARQRNLELAREVGVPSAAIVFDVPLEYCLANNAKRVGRRVPREVIHEQHRLLLESIMSLQDEGFTIVYYLDTRAIESAAITRAPRAGRAGS